MGEKGRVSQSQSNQFGLKGIGLSLFLAVFCSCSSPTKKVLENEVKKSVNEEDVTFDIPDNYSVKEAKQLTTFGENRTPSYSPSGNKIVFASHNRYSHSTHQIYELELKNQYERRITYNDGENFLPSYSPTGREVLYLSNTDEIKERPSFVALVKSQDISIDVVPESLRDPGNNEFINSQLEVYSTNLRSHDIDRLTSNPGYDGFSQYYPDGKRILFVRLNDDILTVESLGTTGRARQRTKRVSTLGNLQLRSLRISPSGNGFTWIKEDQRSELQITDKNFKNTEQHLDGFDVKSVDWFPSGDKLLVAAAPVGQVSAELFTYDFKKECLKRLTYDGFDDVEPSVAPDGASVAFASNRNGAWHIYEMTISEPEKCSYSFAQSDKPQVPKAPSIAQ